MVNDQAAIHPNWVWQNHTLTMAKSVINLILSGLPTSGPHDLLVAFFGDHHGLSNKSPRGWFP